MDSLIVKEFLIPVRWMVCGVSKVRATSLGEAEKLVQLERNLPRNRINMADTLYIDTEDKEYPTEEDGVVVEAVITLSEDVLWEDRVVHYKGDKIYAKRQHMINQSPYVAESLSWIIQIATETIVVQTEDFKN